MKTQIKLALKVLSRRKAFTAISLFGISMTLTVLMVVAAIFDALVSPREPETRADRMTEMEDGRVSRVHDAPGDPGKTFHHE